MENAARRLLEIYKDWAARYGSNIEARAVRKLSSGAGMEMQLEVFELLSSIDRSLTEMEQRRPLRVYRKSYHQWVLMALNVPAAWTGGSDANAVFVAPHLDHLETFADMLDYEEPPLPDEAVAGLRSVVDDALALLQSDTSITDGLKNYMFKLLDDLRTSLDEETILDNFDYRVAADRLWVSLWAAAGQSTANKDSWRATASRMAENVFTSFMGSGPAIAAGYHIAAITAGGS
ncbi:hypothetical protein ITJ66_02435 [Plantibacter sp. VKM Ac-2885]|uniref:hypothetical protein n=1 Tax=Plantibacter sp. VKM Ac-2885 TaxID=2783828 RepID=UPI00188D3ED8|nr:hypothetical protein [Plantibacter sp. VKM Ac-2885]MBF4511331.1 hypothetical protein [Plantibacter sp. VKM Ac-2885]